MTYSEHEIEFTFAKNARIAVLQAGLHSPWATQAVRNLAKMP